MSALLADGSLQEAVVTDAPLSPIVGAVVTPLSTKKRTLGELSLTEGSILTQLAEGEGFEPSIPLRIYRLSKTAH